MVTFDPKTFQGRFVAAPQSFFTVLNGGKPCVINLSLVRTVDVVDRRVRLHFDENHHVDIDYDLAGIAFPGLVNPAPPAAPQ